MTRAQATKTHASASSVSHMCNACCLYMQARQISSIRTCRVRFFVLSCVCNCGRTEEIRLLRFAIRERCEFVINGHSHVRNGHRYVHIVHELSTCGYALCRRIPLCGISASTHDLMCLWHILHRATHENVCSYPYAS